jgi:hypothetical protein
MGVAAIGFESRPATEAKMAFFAAHLMALQSTMMRCKNMDEGQRK